MSPQNDLTFELLSAVTDVRKRLETIEAMLARIEQSVELHRRAVITGLQDQARPPDVKHTDPRSITMAPGQVYSQNSEDGIIAEIFRRIDAPHRTFVEIGVGDGVENNTRLLLELGWTGVWIEGNPVNAAMIRNRLAGPIAAGRLGFIEAAVDRENVATLVEQSLNGRPVDFLSIDIDYNTSHVWRRLGPLRARVSCIEYNAHYPPSVAFEVPHDPDGRWMGTTQFGASLKRLEEIGKEIGSRLVGCDPMGVNAFFVRSDLCDEARFLPPFTAEQHYELPRFPLVQMRGHERHGGP